MNKVWGLLIRTNIDQLRKTLIFFRHLIIRHMFVQSKLYYTQTTDKAIDVFVLIWTKNLVRTPFLKYGTTYVKGTHTPVFKKNE